MPASKSADVIFFTGPPGSGKTRTTMLWTLRRRTPAFYLDWDQVASVLAYEERVDHQSGPVEPVQARYRRAATICAAMAKSVAESGNDCAIVGAWVPDPQPHPDFEGMWTDLQELDPLVMVLLPTLEAALARNDADDSGQGRFAVPADYIRASYTYGWERWATHPPARVLDTSSMTLELAADAIEVAVQQLQALSTTARGAE